MPGAGDDAFRVAADLDRVGVAVAARVVGVVRHHGLLLQTRVRANASGRPGPRVVTGDYRRSIGLQVRSSGAAVSASVGTNRPQGRRLEFGANGVDSAGRAMNQPPYPHFGPALDATGPEFVEALGALVGREFDGG